MKMETPKPAAEALADSSLQLSTKAAEGISTRLYECRFADAELSSPVSRTSEEAVLSLGIVSGTDAGHTAIELVETATSGSQLIDVGHESTENVLLLISLAHLFAFLAYVMCLVVKSAIRIPIVQHLSNVFVFISWN